MPASEKSVDASPLAQQMWTLARRACEQRGGTTIDSYDMLVGIVRLPECEAAQTLDHFGLSLEKILGVDTGASETANGEWSVPVLSVMANAQKIAKAAGEETYNTADVLTAIFDVDCRAKQVLHDLDITSKSIGKLAQRYARVPAYVSRDLTGLARAEKLDPVIGREAEIGRVIRILSRRSKSNPVVLGEPGIGKTAIIEGLAQRIVQNNVPEALRGRRIFEVDLGSMLSGVQVLGTWQERFKQLLHDVQEWNEILFFDDLHLIVGAGRTHKSTMDIATLLKPAMMRGELTVVGATTLDDFRRYIEPDGALSGRFKPVYAHPPSPEQAVEMIDGSHRVTLSRYHGVAITESAASASVLLTDRYVTDRFLPDKAIEVLDDACVTVREKWDASGPHREGAKPRMTDRDVAAAVSELKDIPMARMVEDDRDTLLALEDRIRERMVGHDEVIRTVCDLIREARTDVANPGLPVSMAMLGSSGIGKTELAKSVAEALFATDKALHKIDMSEYSTGDAVDRLIGAGSHEKGTLTEPVRNRPYSVLLLDEIHLSTPAVWSLLYQLFDDGKVTDGAGRTVDFSNCVVLMTSNWTLEEYEATVPTALRGRIGEVVVMPELTEEQLRQIAEREILRMSKRVNQTHHVELELPGDVVSAIAGNGGDASQGARPIRRQLSRHVGRPLSRKLLEEGTSELKRVSWGVDKEGVPEIAEVNVEGGRSGVE